MFGWRKDNEDPFAALKGGSTYQSAPTTASDIGLGDPPATIGSSTSASAGLAAPTVAPAAATLPAQTPGPPQQSPSAVFTAQQSGLGQPTRRRLTQRASGGGSMASVVRLLIIAGVVAAVGIPIATSVKHTVDKIKLPSFNIGGSSTTGGSSSSPGSRHANYLHVGTLRSALARVRRIAPNARLALLRIDAKSFSVTATSPGHGTREIYFGPAGNVVTAGNTGGQRSVPISQVNPNVVGRLISQVERRFHVPARRIDYVLLSAPPSFPSAWIVFTTQPGHPGYEATLSGGGLKRLG